MFPIRLENMFPGNMGVGIRSEAARKIMKKTIRIGVPFKVPPLALFLRMIQHLNI
jgi:hypothetical protein